MHAPCSVTLDPVPLAPNRSAPIQPLQPISSCAITLAGHQVWLGSVVGLGIWHGPDTRPSLRPSPGSAAMVRCATTDPFPTPASPLVPDLMFSGRLTSPAASHVRDSLTPAQAMPQHVRWCLCAMKPLSPSMQQTSHPEVVVGQGCRSHGNASCSF